MSRQRLDLYRSLARALIWAAALTVALAFLAAISIATSDAELGLGTVEREGRAFITLATIGGGIVAGSVLAGLGAILDLLLERRTPAEPGTTPPDDPE